MWRPKMGSDELGVVFRITRFGSLHLVMGRSPLVFATPSLAPPQDGTLINAVMQVDETSRLLLYPQADPLATAPTLPAPAVVLDPNPSGMSRFDGPVRISKQGDLEMGEFIAEPTPTPAQ